MCSGRKLSNLQTSLNVSYSDKTESSLTNDVAIHTIIESFSENNAENIEYLESDFIDTTQFNLHNTQQWHIPADTEENTIYSGSDEILSHSNKNNSSHSLSTPHHDFQLSNSSGSSITKLPATVCSSVSLKSTSQNKENMYVKRGSVKKKKESIMEEAITALKTLSNQPTSENDSAEYFGIFVAARLREMSPLSRKQCEHEIMKCLANY